MRTSLEFADVLRENNLVIGRERLAPVQNSLTRAAGEGQR
jgi:hypothetical protein